MKETVMKKALILLLVVFTSLSAHILFPCTIFNVSKKGLVLAGNNEDGFNTNTKVWFVPGVDGKYGAVWVGFDVELGKMGAMNDQGLFFDGNALKFNKMNAHPELQSFSDDKSSWVRIMKAWEQVMQECATVEKVLDMLSRYDLDGWNNFQLMFADKTGASAVVGADKNGELAITRKQGDFQVSTNYNLANPEFGAYSYPCRRFNIATEMLEEMEELTVEYCRDILSAVHAEGSAVTLYSNVCDLTNGDIYIYNFHNFGEVAKFNLAEELKKGEHVYEIASLFPRKTHAQISYEESRKNMLSSILGQVIEKEGMKAAIKKYYEIKDNYSVIPGQLMIVLHGLDITGRTEEAIELCKVLVKDFSKSPASYKRLGDLYVKNNESKKAIRCYKKVLKLAPDNKEVADLLTRLGSDN